MYIQLGGVDFVSNLFENRPGNSTPIDLSGFRAVYDDNTGVFRIICREITDK